MFTCCINFYFLLFELLEDNQTWAVNSICMLIGQDTARQILNAAPGVVVIDDRTSNHFPTPLEVCLLVYVIFMTTRHDNKEDIGLSCITHGELVYTFCFVSN